MKRLLSIFPIASSAALAACSSISAPGPYCTAEIRYGVAVVITDSITGQPIATGTKLVVRDGAYADSMSTLSANAAGLNTLFGAPERTGTYTLTVTKPGYADWVMGGVQVTRNECHVNQVSVQARLRALP